MFISNFVSGIVINKKPKYQHCYKQQKKTKLSTLL